MIKGAFILLFGSTLAKICPIIIGLIVASSIDSPSYSFFVNFLMLTNVIINFAVLGGTPQIIALNGDNNEVSNNTFKITLFCFSVLFLAIFTTLFTFSFGFFAGSSLVTENPLNVPLYCCGLLMIYIATSRLNNVALNRKAAYVWCIYSLFLLFSCSYWYFILPHDINTLVFTMSASTFLSGLLSFSIAFKFNDFKLFLSSKSFFEFYILKRAVGYSLFGFMIVFVFFFLQNKLQHERLNESAYFSLFYQFFAISIFIPAVLGNILVPRIARGGGVNRYVYFVYFVISLVIFIPFFITYKDIFEYYGLVEGVVGFKEIFVFYLICTLASVNSYSTQILVANKKVALLTLSSVVWAVLVLSYCSLSEFNISNVLESLLLGYLIIFLLLWLWSYKHTSLEGSKT